MLSNLSNQGQGPSLESRIMIDYNQFSTYRFPRTSLGKNYLLTPES
ncbi:hypothetical protein MICAI_2660004 [Microcystis sp. T1-4]|nr:hypothetical protein MICAI_2660004 [Microcystis sp. T1-4]